MTSTSAGSSASSRPRDRSRASDAPPSRNIAVKRRGSCPASIELSGSRRGITSQMNGSATSAAIITIGVKWNTDIDGNPMSPAIDTTSRLVDVPIVVDMPPISTALLTGISVRDAGMPPLAAIAAMIGSIRTSTGVSLTIMLRPNASNSVTNRPSCWFSRHTRVSNRDTGSNAPVVTSPRPSTISAQMVTSA